MQFRVIVVTDPQTHTHTHKPKDRTDYNTLRRSFASAQCNKYLEYCTASNCRLSPVTVVNSCRVIRGSGSRNIPGCADDVMH